ncbi:MAG: phosphatidylglycerol lysyltransferase domain-containing protein [Bacillota bacterium]|nr:phosphatidylglycerol lysyltransferase domain-containing protein [Bacillota bacterium]
MEYNFTSNFIWSKIYKLQIAYFEDRVIVMSDEDDPTFIFPAGPGPVEPVVKVLYEYVSQRGHKLVFNTVLNEDKEKLQAAFPGKFCFEEDRNDFDYVYESERLISLSGKKLSAKRNHINKFKLENPNWEYEVITPENIEETRQMSIDWCKIAGCQNEESLYDESCAVERTFKYFFDLGLTGGLIRSEGKVIAFAIGEELNDNTYVVHIEKAFYDIQGAYQIINQQFAAANCQDYELINREDDAGDEGLRRAKLSYYPAFMVEKSSATLLSPL